MNTTWQSLNERVKVWRTVQLGNGIITRDDFRTQLAARKWRLDDNAYDLMRPLPYGGFSTSPVFLSASLVLVQPQDLLNYRPYTMQQLCDAAFESGLQECADECAAQFCLQFPDDLAPTEWLLFVTRQLLNSNQDPRFFYAQYDALGKNVGTTSGSLDNPGGDSLGPWPMDTSMVFQLPNN